MHAQRYARTQNETASPERLLILLFEAALRHMRAGRAALEAGQGAAATAPLSKAVDIVVELAASFDPARFPALAERLSVVYGFACTRLVAAQTGHDAAAVREAERVFAPVADAFATAVRQLSAGVGR